MVARAAEIDEEATAVEAPPFDLAAAWDAIAVYCRMNPGVDGLRITLTQQGQTVNRFSVPLLREVEVEEESPLTPKQKAILQVVDNMRIGEVLSFDQFATKSGYSASGDLRDFIRSLGAYGRLAPNRLGWERVK